jgi:hypothetical protein
LTLNDIALGDEENWRLIAASLCDVALPVVAGIVSLGKHLDIEAMSEAMMTLRDIWMEGSILRMLISVAMRGSLANAKAI